MKIKFFLIILSISVLSIGCATMKPADFGQVDWKLAVKPTERVPVEQVIQKAISATTKEVYLGEPGILYRVRDGKKEIVVKGPEEAVLRLAPGGEVYAWLIPHKEWQGLYSVRLMQVPDKHLTNIRLTEAPYGIGALILGFQGNLIVGVTPLDDWEGIRGRFQITFWDREGKLLNQVILPRPHGWAIDPLGKAIVFLFDDKAIAFTAKGQKIWELSGRFRKAAIAAGGKLALLNPAARKDIDKVLIFTGERRPTSVRVPTPVHHLTITPDGTQAAVAGSNGRFFYLDTASKKLQEGVKLPSKEYLFISDIQLVKKDIVALGLLHRTGEPPTHKWTRGSVVVVRLDGRLIFQKSLTIRRPLAKFPAITTTFDTDRLIGITEDESFLVDLKKQSIQ